MKIIVVGGNCTNKGAQALLLITMCELKKKYPNAELYFDSQDNFRDNDKYFFKHIDRRALRNALAIKAKKGQAGRVLKDAVWAARDHRWYACFAEFGYLKMLNDVEMIIDISGYNLASKFSDDHNRLFLDIIEYSLDCGIRTIIMPQSFGPFDYKNDREGMLARITSVLNRADVVYAREPGGYEALTNLGVKNVKLSDDLVLLSEGYDLTKVCTEKEEVTEIPISENGSIAIVPNEKVFVNSADAKQQMKTYEEIVNHALEAGNKVFLIYHSNEDLAICRNIKKLFDDKKDVQIIEKELAFYEYEALVTKFKYIIASRYHSIVIAYRQAVPCIGIGWAEKYEYLFNRCGQSQYIHAVNDEGLAKSVIQDMDKLEQTYPAEQTVIRENVKRLRENSCFDEI